MNRFIKHTKDAPSEGLMKLDLESTNIIVYSDGYFAGSTGASFQVGYMIFLADKKSTVDLIEYSTIKSRRVRSRNLRPIISL